MHAFERHLLVSNIRCHKYRYKEKINMSDLRIMQYTFNNTKSFLSAITGKTIIIVLAFVWFLFYVSNIIMSWILCAILCN